MHRLMWLDCAVYRIQFSNTRYKQHMRGALRNTWILFASIAALTIALSYFVGTHVLATEQVDTRTGLQDRERKQ
jgi:hypothetical protein